MLQVEEMCHKFSIPWSPDLDQAYDLKEFWKIQSRYAKTQRYQYKYRALHRYYKKVIQCIKQRIAKCNVAMPQDNPVYNIPQTQEAKMTFRAAIKNLQEMRKQAAERRRDFLVTKLERAAIHGNLDREKAIQQSIKHEERTQCLPMYQSYLQREKGGAAGAKGGLSAVAIPVDPGSNPRNPETKWERIHTKTSMEEELKSYIEKHFVQAQGTPFTVEQLSSLVEHRGITEFTQQVLDGDVTSVPQETSTPAKQLLEELVRIAPEVQSMISLQELARVYTKWKKGTTMSPSGRHLGHYRAMLAGLEEAMGDNTPLVLEPIDRPGDNQQPFDVFRIHHAITMLALKW